MDMMWREGEDGRRGMRMTATFTIDGTPLLWGRDADGDVYAEIKFTEDEFDKLKRWATIQPETLRRQDYIDRDWSGVARLLEDMICAQVKYTLDENDEKPTKANVEYYLKSEIREVWDWLLLEMDHGRMLRNIKDRCGAGEE